MAKLPAINRLVTEDFPDQKKWVGRLLQPLNQFMESVYAGLNKGLTLRDNLAADVLTVDVDGAFPVKLAWRLTAKPIAVLVGDVQRSDGGTFALSGAPGLRWSFNQSAQLQIDEVTGVTPTSTTRYKFTLICFTG